MRWMKRYISHRSPIKVNFDDREITPYIAGQDFLRAVLISAAQEAALSDEEVGFSVPVEAFEHYENWLASVAEAAGMPRFRLIDEPSAAALGIWRAYPTGKCVFDLRLRRRNDARLRNSD